MMIMEDIFEKIRTVQVYKIFNKNKVFIFLQIRFLKTYLFLLVPYRVSGKNG